MRRSSGRRGGTARVVGAIVRANLRRLSRDRTGLLFIVVAPLLLILLIGVASPGGEGSPGTPIGLVAPSDGEGPASRIVERLESDATLDVTRFDDVDAMAAAVRRRVQAAGVEIPSDLDERLRHGRDVEVRFHTDPSGLPPMRVRTAVTQAVVQVGATLRGARVVAERSGISTQAALRASDTLPIFGSVEVASQTVGAPRQAFPSGFAYAAPAYLVLFVFINTVVAAWGLPADRRRGLVRRAFAAPTRASSVLLGEGLYRLLVALLQAGLILGVGALLFGVTWGDPWAVTAIVSLFCLVSTGASLLVGSIASSEQQVTGIGPPLGIGLGMLGGCMWPLEIVGSTMQTIGHATPHAWAVDAFVRVVGAGAGVRDIATELGVLAAFAGGLIGVALVVFGRTLRSARG